ncbi:LLM class flavin-dependent oxidoreductase [Aerococcus urinae]|uniref:LLM class flavin-dependent oxidoreductase n=1 Tax=Aerococcus urinae TaxID=1376 RepID=A0A0X8FEQ4_9LACT|nr:LLM class flavin-dependent oxidoreductase [Aerococcus urinae]AMB95922.1 luciferase [Aerococcus urinae]MCY3032510.1 LLM class flavin-dependent oxidoreductase [Aerococcus urinae]MCY3038468.1 LLM class flavin-dependent oxidoreductase [Aerococcus urinae]MCY3044556.1 LLM class flavin-dependent oxidoreductase [Aerococcus urinae]MCY3048011.1 LLM class flavin-dependent oxidoreductase [Aerococcus urinae]
MTIGNPHVIPQIDTSQGIEFGLYSLGDHMPNPHTGEEISAQERIQQFIKMAQLAEQAGVDIFHLGESHQKYFVSQAHMVILSAIAQATSTIGIGSSATIISTSDPVRVYENAATIDLISDGRMEVVAGRASRLGIFELLGYDVKDYEALYEEKFDLLLQINENEVVNWEGEFRAPLHDAEVIPRAKNGLPIWRAVGGPPDSAIKAALKGVPMYITTLGGSAEYFKQSIDIYRSILSEKGYDVESMPVTTSGFLYVNEDRDTAFKEFYPHLDTGMKRVNGTGFNKRLFAQGKDYRDALTVGDPQLIIDKILYQHELYNNQRYTAQIDFGGIPFKDILHMIDILGETIIPAVKKYTKSDQ